ncbi:YqgE/AlgH family protein [Sulfurivermis fontis]|jgi:putative transcriptional regulator|uniref:YqgE/AlgH family protein n=1 Tax=Sulfurivermis fontis TaxID=1972068 RepID=UPI000FD6E022|nr:YqgE/AlgH family protein [Sulfurivermis fontis]
MTETASLRNHFLIAMPQLADPNFSHTVTYICEHNAEGSLGIVINRPLEITLGDVLQHMQIAPDARVDTAAPVFSGGPVQPERGFVLHRPVGAWTSSLPVTADIALTTSRDIMAAIGQGTGPQQFLLALGYAGWGAGQLEQEIAQNAWLSGPADPAILFELPVEERWGAAAALIGVDLTLLSSEAGHA